MKLLTMLLFSTIYIFAEQLAFKSFQSDFIQNIKNPSGSVITYEGSLITNDSNYIIWRYTKPIIKEVYILDDQVIINEPELEQTIYTSTNNQLNLNTLIKNAKMLNKGIYEASINEIKYHFIFKDDILMSVSYLDEVENQVAIIFQNQQKDKKLDSKIFLFDQNPDFDIIKQ